MFQFLGLVFGVGVSPRKRLRTKTSAKGVLEESMGGPRAVEYKAIEIEPALADATLEEQDRKRQRLHAENAQGSKIKFWQQLKNA